MSLILGNSIAFAHFRLRGGWKSMAIYPSIYAGVILAAVLLSAHFDSSHAKAAYFGWTITLLGLQLLIVMIFGAMRVVGAVRQDVSVKMLESHRLMPISGAEAVIGYMLGGAAMMLALGAVNLLCGIGTSFIAGIAPDRWLTANAVLAGFIAFVWIIAVFSGFYSRNVVVLCMILTAIGGMSQGLILWVEPALTILVSPLAGHSIFTMKGTSSDPVAAHIFGIGAQLILGSIFFVAATRKFRRPDAPAFSPMLGLTLLTAWVTLSILGMENWKVIGPVFLSEMRLDDTARVPTQVIASLLSGVCLALLPLGGSIRAGMNWRHHRQLDDPALARRPVPPVIMGIMGIGIVMLICAVAPAAGGMRRGEAALRTALCLGAVVFSMGLLLSARRRMGISSNGLVALWLLATGLLPLIFDSIRHSISTDPRDELLGIVSTLSPIGTLIGIWGQTSDTTFGLTCQLLLAGLALVFYLRALRRSAVKPGAANSPGTMQESTGDAAG